MSARQHNMTSAGLEAAIPGSVGRCLIHWATRPSDPWLEAGTCTIDSAPAQLHLLPRQAAIKPSGYAAMRQPEVEPGAQAWEACMLPLHYWRSCYQYVALHGMPKLTTQERRCLYKCVSVPAWVRTTCGLMAMTSVSHAEGRQLDPGQVYCCSGGGK